MLKLTNQSETINDFCAIKRVDDTLLIAIKKNIYKLTKVNEHEYCLSSKNLIEFSVNFLSSGSEIDILYADKGGMRCRTARSLNPLVGFVCLANTVLQQYDLQEITVMIENLQGISNREIVVFYNNIPKGMSVMETRKFNSELCTYITIRLEYVW